MSSDERATTGVAAEQDETATPWRRLASAALVALVSTLALWIVAPDAVRATFSGPGPLLRVGAVVLGFVALSTIVGRLVPNAWLARAIVLVPALAVTWWALSPYVGDDVVDEAFPVVETVATTAPGQSEVRTGSDVGSGADDDDAPATTQTTTPPEPVALASGSFQGLTGHRGAGTATVFDLPDGSRILRLEGFDVSNGPGLEVHLVPGTDQRGPNGGRKLADLKGNVGDQNYDVPPDLDLAGDWTVLIWCAPFTVEVANATASFG